MQSETLAQEFSRLVKEYHEGDDHTKPEAWNLLADYAVDNASAIAAALSDQERAVEVKGLEKAYNAGFEASSSGFNYEFCDDYEHINEFTAERAGAVRAIAAALVDVPVEPVAKQWCAYEDGHQHTNWYPDGYGDRAGWEALAKRNPAKYQVVTRDLYTSPPLPHREGQDSAEVIEEGAKLLAAWFKHSWDGLGDRDISGIYPDFAKIPHFQGGKPALRKIAAAILALAATRSDSATGQSGTSPIRQRGESK